MSLLQAAKQALEALENYGIEGTKSIAGQKCTNAITALRQAIAQAEQQEPVANALQVASVALQDIACSSQTENILWWQARAREAQKQIAECLTNNAPPQREWVEPSDEQIWDALETHSSDVDQAIRAVLKLAKELNHV